MNRLSAKRSTLEIGCGLVVASVLGIIITYLWRKKMSKNVAECWKLLPFSNFPGEVCVLPQHIKVFSKPGDFDSMTVNNLLADIQKVKLLGFDCEWTTLDKKRKKVALLQITSISGNCWLIRLCHVKDQLPHEFTRILKDKHILKVGVGSVEDAKKLYKDYTIVVNGCVDLRGLTYKNPNVKSHSLKGLAAKYLNVALDKSKKIQCSDWEAESLSREQIEYAASDSLVAVRIFTEIVRKSLMNLNGQASSSQTLWTQEGVWNAACNLCEGLVDVAFRSEKKQKYVEGVNQCKNNLHSFKPFKPFKPYSARKGPLYDNCKLQAPDGQLLSTCDKKKAAWYIDKNLADVVSDEPFTVKLRFEPAGRPASELDYYTFDKENVCVVCGKDESVVRKNVVPHEYRKHFPLVLKDHVSHDILPLCVTCHQQAGYYDGILRNKIAEEYNAPVGSKQAVQLLEDAERRTVRSAGRALRSAGGKIPEARRCHLEATIKDFFQVDSASDELIEQASMLETRYKNEAYCPHGQKVVATILLQNHLQGLLTFEKRWRRHFVDTMQPKHLPHLWSVDHNHDRVLQKASS